MHQIGSFVSPNILRRSRLENLLESIWTKKLILILGAAGCGKTTLAASFLREQSLPFFWYSIEPSHDQSSQFTDSLCQHIHNLEPAVQNRLQDFSSVENMGTAIIEAASAIEDLVVVIDNYHFTETNSNFDNLIQMLIYNSPPHLHFIVISRKQPEWQLTRKRVYREMLEINDAMLAFNFAEVCSFCQNLYDLDWQNEELRLFYTLTEGWVAAMVVIAEKVSLEPGFRAILSKEPAVVLKSLPDLTLFLEEELYSTLQEKHKTLLLSTSILEEIPLELGKQLVGDEADAILADLVSHNLLVACIDIMAGVYRCHGLWQAFLLHKAGNVRNKPKMEELYNIAGSFYLDAQKWKESFRCYVEGNNLGMIIYLLKKIGPEILDFNLTEKLRNLFISVPAARIEGEPWIQFSYACSQRFRDPSLCYYYLHRALEGFRRSGDSQGEVRTLCLRTEVLMFYPGGLQPMEDLISDDSLDFDLGNGSNMIIAAYKQLYAALSHCYLTGQLQKAISLGEQARRTSFVTQDANLNIYSCWVLALTSSFLGNFEVAEGYLAEAIEKKESPGHDEMALAAVPYLVGLNAALSGQFEVAKTALKMASRESQALGLEALDFYIRHYKAMATRYLNDHERSD